MLQQTTCHGMTQCMCSTVCDTDSMVGIANNFTHSIGTDGNVMWGDNANKDFGVLSRWAFKTQIIHNRFTSGCRHRQNIFTAGLVMSDRN